MHASSAPPVITSNICPHYKHAAKLADLKYEIKKMVSHDILTFSAKTKVLCAVSLFYHFITYHFHKAALFSSYLGCVGVGMGG